VSLRTHSNTTIGEQVLDFVFLVGWERLFLNRTHDVRSFVDVFFFKFTMLIFEKYLTYNKMCVSIDTCDAVIRDSHMR